MNDKLRNGIQCNIRYSFEPMIATKICLLLCFIIHAMKQTRLFNKYDTVGVKILI